jgi:hypothetical protein
MLLTNSKGYQLSDILSQITPSAKSKDETPKKKPLTPANQRLLRLVVVGGFEPPTSAL